LRCNSEVGIYAAHRQEIGIQKDEDEDKRVELLNSLKEWLECQIYSIDKYLGLIEPDAIAVWKAALNAPNAKEAFGEEAYNDLKLQTDVIGGGQVQTKGGMNMTKLVVDEDYINERTTFFESSTGQLLSEFKEFKIASNLTSKDEIEAVRFLSRLNTNAS
jgi:hypothetical protein